MDTTVGQNVKAMIDEGLGKNHLNSENIIINVIQDQANHDEDEKTWKVIAPTIV